MEVVVGNAVGDKYVTDLERCSLTVTTRSHIYILHSGDDFN